MAGIGEIRKRYKLAAQQQTTHNEAPIERDENAPPLRSHEPELGCGIHELVFAPNNSITTTQVVDQARRALVLHEPRIDVLDVTAESTPERPNLLLIRIGYRIRENNALGNFVYPFFVTEGA